MPDVLVRASELAQNTVAIAEERIRVSRTSLALYREDLLAAKGIKDPAPKNFQEFFDLAKEMTAAKQNKWAWTRVPTVDHPADARRPERLEGGRRQVHLDVRARGATRARSRRPARWSPPV